MSARKRGLGKGLDALLGGSGQASPDAAQPISEPSSASQDGALKTLPVDLIQRGKYQPRKDVEPEALQELADSIRAQGVMQPIVVRPISDTRYEIIAGERRWRATQLAGLDEIPAVVREVGDDAAIAMALIENLQREDLNPIEEAMGLQRLQQEFELTQQQVAEAVGKSRSSVANLLRLMTLQDEVRRLLEHGDLEMGHARALLGLADTEQAQAARRVVQQGLSVRQTEALVRQLQKPANAKGATSVAPGAMDPNIRSLQNDLARRLGAKVEIRHKASGKGQLVLNYTSLEELDGILGHIK